MCVYLYIYIFIIDIYTLTSPKSKVTIIQMRHFKESNLEKMFFNMCKCSSVTTLEDIMR